MVVAIHMQKSKFIETKTWIIYNRNLFENRKMINLDTRSGSPSNKRRVSHDVGVMPALKPPQRFPTNKAQPDQSQPIVISYVTFGTSNKSLFLNDDLCSSQRTPAFPNMIPIKDESEDSHEESEYEEIENSYNFVLVEESEKTWKTVHEKMKDFNSKAVYKPCYLGTICNSPKHFLQ